MTALTLPGTIPELLRRGSPVICTAGLFAGRPGVVVEVNGDGSADVSVNDCRAGNVERYEARELTLDLTDATGRAHAVWWTLGTFDALFSDSFRLPCADARALRLAASGEPMTSTEIDRLRLVCLHVAGVAS